MENIINDETVREVSRILGNPVQNKPLLDTSKIMLVAETNPKLTKYANVTSRASSTATGNTTLYTTPTDRDFYLTDINISISKNVTNDITACYVNVTPQEYPALRIIDLALQPLTATDSINIQKSLTFPIKLQRGTTIVLVKTFTAGAGTFTGIVCGFTTDGINV